VIEFQDSSFALLGPYKKPCLMVKQWCVPSLSGRGGGCRFSKGYLFIALLLYLPQRVDVIFFGWEIVQVAVFQQNWTGGFNLM
jgi:hypothetical protein